MFTSLADGIELKNGESGLILKENDSDQIRAFWGRKGQSGVRRR